MSNQVKKLNAECASKIRRSQVITSISDIVRELVDNSIDSGARSLQVMLENFGLKKIEVKDSGHGIAAEDIACIFQGGYTSKLYDESHLSCGNQYGFRGEALAAICSFNGMTVVTKTQDDQGANKYVLDKQGKIVSENPVALANGTVMTIRDVFSDFPVRHKYSSEIKVSRNELKEIESYLKSVSIANPGVYMILYHSGSMIWSKPSVKNTEQAITTVFGIALAQKLAKCPVVEFVPEPNANDGSSWKGSLELFLPQAPVEMKCVGFTNNKMTMIFVNRRRVIIAAYEQLIKRYAVGAADSPTQADQRKFPAAVFLIDVPPTEVDFNRDLNKSKIFLSCHDLVLLRLEEMLQSYYGIDLDFLSPSQLSSESVATDSMAEAVLDSSASSEIELSLSADGASILKPPLSTPEKRQKNVTSFLKNLTSPNFSKYDNSNKRISPSNPTSSMSKVRVLNVKVTDLSVPENEKRGGGETSESSVPIANFTISSDESMEEMPSCSGGPVRSKLSSNDGACSAQDVEPENQLPVDIDSGENAVMQYFLTPSFTRIHSRDALTSDCSQIVPSPSASVFTLSGFSKPQRREDEFPPCGAILHTNNAEISTVGSTASFRTPMAPLAKKPKLFDLPVENYSPKSEVGGRKHRQVTLESLKNWNSTSKSFGSPTLHMPKIKTTLDLNACLENTDEALTPKVLHFMESKGDNWNESPDSGYLDKPPKNDIGLLCLQATVSLASLKSKKSTQQIKLPHQASNGPEITIINQLENRRYYIVIVDGLLGVFNPKQVLALRPHLEYDLGSNYTHMGKNSDECIGFLLQEFTKFASLLDGESASQVFHALVDLEA